MGTRFVFVTENGSIKVNKKREGVTSEQ